MILQGLTGYDEWSMLAYKHARWVSSPLPGYDNRALPSSPI